MNKNKFLYVAALFGMMVLVSCSSHDSAKNVTVTSEQSGAESQAASDIVSKPLTLLQSKVMMAGLTVPQAQRAFIL